MKLKTYRARAHNLRTVIRRARLTETKLAKKLRVSKSYVSQLIGPHPVRHISEESARKFERKLKLPEGALDKT